MTVVSTDAKPLMGGTSLPIAPGAAITPAPAPVAAAPQNMPPAAAPIGSGAVPTFGYGGSYGNSANTNSKPVIASGAHHNTIPITALNPYSNKWAIKARITSKADKRSWYVICMFKRLLLYTVVVSPDLLLSYPPITLPLHNTIILIKTPKTFSISTNP